MTQTLSQNLGTLEQRRTAVYMAEALYVPNKPAEYDALADAWIRGKVSDNDFATSDQEAAFHNRRLLALMIARTLVERNGEPTAEEMGLFHATMNGSQTVEDLAEQIGTWNR